MTDYLPILNPPTIINITAKIQKHEELKLNYKFDKYHIVFINENGSI